MPNYTPFGLFPYIEGDLNAIQQPLQSFQEQVEARIIALTPGSGSGLADPGSNGLLARTAPGVTAARTLQYTAGIAITNPSGAAGDPTISPADDLAALEALSTTGRPKRTGVSTWTISAIDLAAEVSGILASGNGGTGNGFTKFSGPASSEKTFTLPNASATILTDAAVVTVAQGGIGVGTLAVNAVLYGNSASAVQALAVNAAATNKFLTQSSSNVPTWATIAASDLPGSFAGFANPTAQVGLSAINGSAATAMRSDAAPTLDVSISPTWTGTHIFTTAKIVTPDIGANISQRHTVPEVTSDTITLLAAAQALTSKTYNGLTITSTTGTFTLASGKTLTVSNTLTFSGTDSKSLTLTGALSIAADTTITGGGTVALGGFTFTVPATGTAVLTSRTITEGAGLAGNTYDLSANRTLAMGAPSSLSSTSVNSASGTTHSHAIDATIARSAITISVTGLGLSGGGDLTANRIINLASSSNPGAAASIVATNASGYSQLVRLGIGTTPTQSLEVSGNAFLSAATANLYMKDVSTGWQSAATTVITPQSGNAIRSTSYTSGLVGWNINAAGDIEANNIVVRGELRASVFKVSEIAATAGTFGVFYSAASLYADTTTPGSVGGGFTFNAKNSDAGGMLFAVSDVIRAKAFVSPTGTIIGDSWFTITTRTNHSTYTTYDATLQSGSTSTTFRAGTAFVDYGPSGSGFITLSADGTVGASPNLTMGKHAGSPWSATTTLTRLGNLNGAYGYAVDIYGLGAGQYGSAGQSWFTVETINGFRIGNNVTTLYQIDTSGNVIQGEVASGKANSIFTAGAFSLRVNTTQYFGVDTSGNATFGQVATNQGNAFWNASNKRLEFRGGAGGTVVQAYIDTNGSITGQAGNVVIDSNGLNLRPAGSIYYSTSGVTNITFSGSNGRFTLQAPGDSGTSTDGKITFYARNPAGTKSLTFMLDSNDGDALDTVARLYNTTSTTKFWVGASGGNPAATLSVSGTGYFTGNVGIGTSSAARRLVVSYNGAEGFEIGPGAANGDTGSAVQFITYNRSASSWITQNWNARNWYFGALVAGSFGFNIRDQLATTSSSFGLLVDAGTNSSDTCARFRSAVGTEFLYVGGDGRVGVGTVSPAAKFQANGSANTWTVFAYGSSTTGQSYGVLSQAGTNGADYSLAAYDYTGAAMYLGVRGDGYVSFNSAIGGARQLALITTSASGSYFEMANGGGTYGYLGCASAIGTSGSPTTADLGLYANGDLFLQAGGNDIIVLGTRLTIWSTAIRFAGYGAGTLVTDSGGNVTASSDLKLKNVIEPYARGLSALREFQPWLYTWKPGFDTNDTSTVYAGFIIDDKLQRVMPEAVMRGKVYRNLWDRAIVAAHHNAILELDRRDDDQQKQILEIVARIKILENQLDELRKAA